MIVTWECFKNIFIFNPETFTKAHLKAIKLSPKS